MKEQLASLSEIHDKIKLIRSLKRIPQFNYKRMTGGLLHYFPFIYCMLYLFPFCYIFFLHIGLLDLGPETLFFVRWVPFDSCGIRIPRLFRMTADGWAAMFIIVTCVCLLSNYAWGQLANGSAYFLISPFQLFSLVGDGLQGAKIHV